MINVELTNDTRWPISMDTDAGRVFLTIAEAESLYQSLHVCLIEFDQTESTKMSNHAIQG